LNHKGYLNDNTGGTSSCDFCVIRDHDSVSVGLDLQIVYTHLLARS